MSKFYITGADGLMGTHATSYLSHLNLEVEKLNRTNFDLRKNYTFDQLEEKFKDAKCILHYGAHVPKDGNFDNFEEIFKTNVESCLSLGEFCWKKDIPIIFLSGATIYVKSQQIFNNSDKIHESSEQGIGSIGGFYGYSKILAENIFNFLREKGLKVAILRPSSIYGYTSNSSKLINAMLHKAKSNEEIIIDNPKLRINLIHASDIVRASIECINQQNWNTFNIGSQSNYSIEEIANTITNIVGSGKVNIISNQNPEEIIRFNLDSSKISEMLKFKCNVDIDEGIKLILNKKYFRDE